MEIIFLENQTIVAYKGVTGGVPCAVPALVQAFSKSFLRFHVRHNDLLLSLPGRREDQAFIVDRKRLPGSLR